LRTVIILHAGGIFTSGLKRPGREVDHSPQSSADV